MRDYKIENIFKMLFDEILKQEKTKNLLKSKKIT
jgi:hypothetical protein